MNMEQWNNGKKEGDVTHQEEREGISSGVENTTGDNDAPLSPAEIAEARELRQQKEEAELDTLLMELQAEYKGGLASDKSISEKNHQGADDILAERARLQAEVLRREEESSISPGHNNHVAEEILHEREVLGLDGQ